MSQIELACREVVFHFNKKHLEDATIPMWVLKTKGETFYVHHVDCQKGWSTKETEDNPHTKGAIKVKNCLLVIGEDSCATVTELTEVDRTRLAAKETKPIPLITSFGSRLKQTLEQMNIAHNLVKKIGGGCGTLWFVTEVKNPKQFLMLSVAMSDTDIRVLKENESYYQLYDQKRDDNDDWLDEDDYYDEDDSDED